MTSKQLSNANLNIISESDFQLTVIEYARLMGWKVFHPYGCEHYRKNTPGYPDLTMVRNGRLLFVELKTQKGNVTDKQTEWLDALRTVESELLQVYVWRPSDWDTIYRILM